MKSEGAQVMNPLRSIARLAALGLGVLALATAGCEASSPKLRSRDAIPPGEAELRKIVSLYIAYAKANNNKSPANAEQLKAWAKGLPKAKLQEFEIEDLDKVFVSPRDNQPFVVIPRTGPGPGRVIACEKTGVNGARSMRRRSRGWSPTCPSEAGAGPRPPRPVLTDQRSTWSDDSCSFPLTTLLLARRSSHVPDRAETRRRFHAD
jgi:hypothetical protein